MAWLTVEIVNDGALVTNYDCGCGETTPLGYVNIYNITNIIEQIYSYTIPKTVPYTKKITELVTNNRYRASLFAWQGDVIEYVDFTYQPPCITPSCDFIIN